MSTNEHDDNYINNADFDFGFVEAYDDDPAQADERLLPDNACEGGDCKILGTAATSTKEEITFPNQLYRSSGKSKVSVRFSKVYNSHLMIHFARYSTIGLDSLTAWHAGDNRPGQWVEYDLGELRHISGIVIQGLYRNIHYGISTYEVELSMGEGKPYVAFEQCLHNRLHTRAFLWSSFEI